MLWNKTVKTAWLLFFLCSAPCFAGGSPAPDFSLNDINGNRVTLSSCKGKVVFIDFWATWCPPCRKATPAVERLYKKYEGSELAVFGINIENDLKAAKKFAETKKLNYPILVGDDTIGQEYTVQGIPAFFILNTDGEIVKRYTGYYPGMENEWEKEIDILLKNLPKKNVIQKTNASPAPRKPLSHK